MTKKHYHHHMEEATGEPVEGVQGMSWVDEKDGETPLEAALREHLQRARGLSMRLERIRMTCLTARERGVRVKPETILHLINE